jgi:outer membrane receptor for ferrienterochelin and colicins
MSLLPASLCAQRVLKAPEVVVTATRSGRPLADVPVPTTVISARDIELTGAVSVTEALQNALPGLLFTPDAMGNNLRLRGLTTRYVLILVDGERLVAEGAGGNVNLDRVAAGDVERIEVVGGAAAALWGAGAVGGVVNIITKRGSGVSAAAAAGNHNTWRAEASADVTAGNFTGHGSVLRNSSGGSLGLLPYTDHGGNARVGWAAGRAKAGATGRFFSHETFNPEGAGNTTHRLAHSWMAGAHGGYAWTNNTLDISLNSDNYTDYVVFERRDNERERENRASILGARAVDVHRFGERLELVGGAEFNHEESFATETLGAQPATRTLRDGAIFAQTALRGAATEYIFGARYTRSSRFGGAFSPSLSALWRHGRWRLRGGAGTSFRPPSIKELYYDYDHQGMFHIWGNPALKAENGLYTQLSAEYTFGTVNASATIYHNHIRNKITQYQAGRDLHYTNVGSATLRGVDANLLWAPAARWTMRAAYGYCDAHDNVTHRQLISTPRHSGTASLSWTGWLTAQLGTRAISSYTHLTSTGDTRRSRGQVVWRIALSREIFYGIAATAKVENIFDTRSVSDPAGRQLLIGLKYQK